MKSPHGLVKLEYFPDGSCLGMALQESLEEGYKADYPTDDGGIHPDFFKPCITCCRRTTRTRWALREHVECLPRPLKLRRSVCAKTPQTFVAAILRCPCSGSPCACGRRRGGPRDGDPAEVAVSVPRPLNRRRSNPSNFVADPAPAGSNTAAATPPRAGKGGSNGAGTK